MVMSITLLLNTKTTRSHYIHIFVQFSNLQKKYLLRKKPFKSTHGLNVKQTLVYIYSFALHLVTTRYIH